MGVSLPADAERGAEGAGIAAGGDAGLAERVAETAEGVAGVAEDVVQAVTGEAGIADAGYTWDEAAAPQYVLRVGDASLPQQPDGVGMTYGGLDDCGRATWAMLVADGPWYQRKLEQGRDETELPDPAGWPADNPELPVVTPDGKVYQGYFWNRSHLVADALGGDPVVENLVIGTRMQNVGSNDGEGGMLYVETLARDWLAAHPSADDRLYYRAEAIYQGTEPIPRAVRVDVLSGDGTIDGEWIVFNAAKGYSIDYTTGAVQPQ